MSKHRAAIMIPAALVALVALVVVPLAIDQPSGAQTPRIMALAFTMRSPRERSHRQNAGGRHLLNAVSHRSGVGFGG
jgi:hypothetical protein